MHKERGQSECFIYAINEFPKYRLELLITYGSVQLRRGFRQHVNAIFPFDQHFAFFTFQQGEATFG